MLIKNLLMSVCLGLTYANIASANDRINSSTNRLPAQDSDGKYSTKERISLTKSEIRELQSIPDIAKVRKLISEKNELAMFNYGVQEIAHNTVLKLKHSESLEKASDHEQKAMFWGDCLYKIWHEEGIKAASAARSFAINTPQKKALNLKIDKNYGNKIYPAATVDKFVCLKQVGK